MESNNFTAQRKGEMDTGGDLEKTIITHQSIVVSGPLPLPAILKQYDEVVPGAAERIITLAENQSRHRQALEKSVIKSGNIKSVLGTVFAFIIACLGLIIGGYTAIRGQPFFGASVSILVLGSMVGAFIYGTNRTTAEIKGKKEG